MKKSLVNFLVFFVAGLAVGLLLGWCLPHKTKSNQLARTSFFRQDQPERVIDNLQGKVSGVEKQVLKFDARISRDGEPVLATLTAQVTPATAIYLLTPKTNADLDPSYQKKIEEIKDKLKQAIQTKKTAQIASLTGELRTLALAKNTETNNQVKSLNEKMNSLPPESAEYQEAQRAYLELTSAFKYSQITLADIKNGDFVQVWSKEDLNDKDKFIATKVEIRR